MDIVGSVSAFVGNGVGAAFALAFIAAMFFGAIAQSASHGGWRTQAFWFMTIPCYGMSLFIAATVGKVIG